MDQPTNDPIISPTEEPTSSLSFTKLENETKITQKNTYHEDLIPLRKEFSEIKWNIFENWNLYRLYTPLDGSCLFHAICNSYFGPYHEEVVKGKKMSKSKIVATLRKDLSEKLSEKVNNQDESPIHYDLLYGGNVRKFSESVPEFNIKHMQSQLDSHNSIGYGYIEFIGNCLNLDIYILEATRKDIYNTDELPFTIKGNRNSIVLYYVDGHYELVGIKKEAGFVTYFSPSHTFIKYLYNRVQEIIHNQK
jgi:hypothetical protein